MVVTTALSMADLKVVTSAEKSAVRTVAETELSSACWLVSLRVVWLGILWALYWATAPVVTRVVV